MLQRMLQREEGSRLQRWLLLAFPSFYHPFLSPIFFLQRMLDNYNGNNNTQNPTPIFSSACGAIDLRIMAIFNQIRVPSAGLSRQLIGAGGPLPFTLAFAPALALFLSLLQQNASPKQLKGDKVQLTHSSREHSIMVRQSQAAGACSS